MFIRLLLLANEFNGSKNSLKAIFAQSPTPLAKRIEKHEEESENKTLAPPEAAMEAFLTGDGPGRARAWAVF